MFLADRVQQARLWQALNWFKANLHLYDSKGENEACRLFGQRTTKLVRAQIERWAKRSDAPREGTELEDAVEQPGRLAPPQADPA
jgi:hypothetical protein